MFELILQISSRKWRYVSEMCLNLQYEEAGVEDAGIDEDSAKVTAPEEFIGVEEEEVVGIEHHHAIILDQLPCVQLV